jgi:hypothetical protein
MVGCVAPGAAEGDCAIAGIAAVDSAAKITDREKARKNWDGWNFMRASCGA